MKVVAYCQYGSFAEVIRATGPIAKMNPFRFSTKYQDDETDLLYYGYRYYNASAGRWLTRDPFGESAGPGVYPLASCNPINNFDVLGLCEGGGGGDPEGCKCTEIKITFNPKRNGDEFKWGFTRDPLTGQGRYKLGNNIKVSLEFQGDDTKCEFHQDESGAQSASGHDDSSPLEIPITKQPGNDNIIDLVKYSYPANPTQPSSTERYYWDELGYPDKTGSLTQIGYAEMQINGTFF